MPACFSLTKKGNSEPSKFSDIDAELCSHFNQPCDPVKYLAGWYDAIGLSIALGQSIDQIITRYENTEYTGLYFIAMYLKEHYVPDTWYSR